MHWLVQESAWAPLCLHVPWVYLSMLRDPGLPASQSLEWTRKVSTFLQWMARKALLSPPLGSDIKVVSRPFRNTPYTMAVVQGVCTILKKSVSSHRLSCPDGRFSCIFKKPLLCFRHVQLCIFTCRYIHTPAYNALYKVHIYFISCIIYKIEANHWNFKGQRNQPASIVPKQGGKSPC